MSKKQDILVKIVIITTLVVAVVGLLIYMQNVSAPVSGPDGEPPINYQGPTGEPYVEGPTGPPPGE